MSSSVNNYFTLNYSQPEEYHFSHDSIFLSRQVFEIIKSQGLSYDYILDLCAGCGVVGIDLLYHLNKENLKLPTELDFIEVQEIYSQHFEKNMLSIKPLLKASLKTNLKATFIRENYSQVIRNPQLQGRYQLIICNPPYFRLNHGSLSNSEFKNRCRFFIDSDFKSLIEAISYCLAPDGKAFILIKNLEKHGLNIQQELKDYASDLRFQKIGVVRATDLYEFTKLEKK